jgi:hypothetical protein
VYGRRRVFKNEFVVHFTPIAGVMCASAALNIERLRSGGNFSVYAPRDQRIFQLNERWAQTGDLRD